MNFCKPGKSWFSRNSINKKNVAPQRSEIMVVNKILSISWSLGHPSVNKEMWAKRIVGPSFPYFIFIWTKMSHKQWSGRISLCSHQLQAGMFARQLLGQNWSNSELESDFLIVRIVLSDSINKSLSYYLSNLFFFIVLFLVENNCIREATMFF